MVQQAGCWPTVNEGAKGAPELLNVLLVTRFSRRSGLVMNGHAIRDHHCLQAAFGAKSIELIRVRPTPRLEKQLGVSPVPRMGIGEVCRMGHVEPVPAKREDVSTSLQV